jgi:hypothetical protein
MVLVASPHPRPSIDGAAGGVGASGGRGDAGGAAGAATNLVAGQGTTAGLQAGEGVRGPATAPRTTRRPAPPRDPGAVADVAVEFDRAGEGPEVGLAFGARQPARDQAHRGQIQLVGQQVEAQVGLFIKTQAHLAGAGLGDGPGLEQRAFRVADRGPIGAQRQDHRLDPIVPGSATPNRVLGPRRHKRPRPTTRVGSSCARPKRILGA